MHKSKDNKIDLYATPSESSPNSLSEFLQVQFDFNSPPNWHHTIPMNFRPTNQTFNHLVTRECLGFRGSSPPPGGCHED